MRRRMCYMILETFWKHFKSSLYEPWIAAPGIERCWDLISYTALGGLCKPVARPVLQGWQNYPGKISWYKIQALISYFML